MHFLLLCILSSTAIFIIFKIVARRNIPSLPVIVINYLTASLTGLLLNPVKFDAAHIFTSGWLSLSIIIGLLFISMFFIVAYSSKLAGLSITTLAGKMSVVLPISFSFLIDPTDQLSPLKSIGLLLALIGVLLTVYQANARKTNWKAFAIPLLLFFGMGIVDSLVKLAQHRHVSDPDTALFSAVLFINAFLAGTIVSLLSPSIYKEYRKGRTWFYGIMLGLVNFGSIFFLVRALNYVDPGALKTDSSIIFGINNLGVVSLSVMAGFLLFREKLSKINRAGIALSALAIILFTLI